MFWGIKELLNPHRLNLKIKDSKLETNHSHTQIFTRWNNLLQTTPKNEEQLQTDFLNDIFGDILGYTYKRGETETNLEKEEKTELDGQKPDGILGFFTSEAKDCKVVIELKDSRTNLDAKQNRKGDSRTPVGQAFDYATKYQGIEFVIVSNFKEIRLYRSNYQGKYQEFKMDELANNEAKRKEFQFLICKQNLIGITKDTGSLVKKLLDDETKRDTEIQNKFYKEYKALREEFVNDILKQNQTTPDTAIAKAQKLFDRLLFIRFCEDNNLITKPFEKVETAKQLGLGLWDGLKLLFTSIDKGNLPHIHKFNGGLFASDETFNDIKIETKLLEKLIAFLCLYHFKNDISVNILGHIFEQSITDLEALKANLHDETHDKNQGKRKKDGIFYTPEYITKYIVEEAVGGWLKERKEEIKLNELEPQEVPTIKPKKWINPNGELINRYKLYAEKLQSIKVLDPACGSGAFLVEVFNYLENEWLSVSEALKKLGDDTELGLFNYQTIYKSILQNNIYGVDLNSESVQITKLSLWLKTANSRDELTTLDNNIKVGNSLIDDEKLDPKAFQWDKEFPFKFDVVVGNPPYGTWIDEEHKKWFDDNYKIQDYQKDLYLLFLERYKILIQDKGLLGVIISNTWLQSIQFNKIRNYLMNEYFWKKVLLLNEKAFEATVDTHCIVFKKEKQRNTNFQVDIRIDNNIKLSHIISQDATQIDETTISFEITPEKLELYKKIKNNSKQLKDFCDVYSGITPFELGAGVPAQTKEIMQTKPYVAEGNKPAPEWRPLLRGGQIDKYLTTWNNDYWVLYGKHLAAPRDPAIFEAKDKLMFRQTGDSIIATYINTDFVARKNLHICLPKEGVNALFILALVNSKLMDFYYSILNPEKGEALAEVKKFHVEILPIPQITIAEQKPFVEKAQAMLDLTKQLNELSSAFLEYLKAKMGSPSKLSTKLQKWYNLKDDEFLTELNKLAKAGNLASFDERAIFTAFKDDGKKAKEIQSTIIRTDMEIDKMVYALYGLSEEEIGIVEGLVV